MTLLRRQIMWYIPHRWLFLLLDSVEVDLDHCRATGCYRVHWWHPIWLFCHFPGNPIFPGVFMPEMMSQIAGVYCGVKMGKPVYGYLVSSSAKYRWVVRPGDVVVTTVKLLQERGQEMVRFSGRARVGDRIVCDATFSLSRA